MTHRWMDRLYATALVVQLLTFVAGVAGFFGCLGKGHGGVAGVVLVLAVVLIGSCSWVRASIRRETRARIERRVRDAVLGELIYAHDAWWGGTVQTDDGNVGFRIGGDLSPDLTLLGHARDIVGSYGAFREQVQALISSEASRQEQFAQEIRSLEVKDVCLLWPDRPDDGMIYFSGSNASHLWRCDYVERVPVALGFDS